MSTEALNNQDPVGRILRFAIHGKHVVSLLGTHHSADVKSVYSKAPHDKVDLFKCHCPVGDDNNFLDWFN